MIKRILDFSIALIGVLLLLPFYPFIWLAIKLSFNRLVFIKEERVGKNHKLIHLYRFRVSNSAKNSVISGLPVEEVRQDSRIDRIVRFLKLEDWPLLINVLKGELSFIGPGPEKPEFVKFYTDEQKQVLTVRPGIWEPYDYLGENRKNDKNGEQINWQEHYRKYIVPEKLKAELTYIQNRRFGRDIRVLVNFFEVKIRKVINKHLIEEAQDRNFFFPLDLFLVFVSYFLSYQLRFEWAVPTGEYLILVKSLPFVMVFRIAVFYYFGLYKNLLKYVGIRDLVAIISACSISSILIVSAIYLIGLSAHSRSIFLIDWLFCISLIGGLRLFIRLFNEKINIDNKIRRNVIIIGAGDVGEMLLRQLNKNGRDKYNVVGFIDDEKLKHGRTIHGVKVLGACQDIPEMVPLLRIDEVLITVTQISSDEMKSILNYCKQAGVRHRVVPTVSDLLNGSVHLSRFRKVEISDLFGRKPVELDLCAIQKFLCGKRVLVTGAGGSIGAELCRQIAEYKPECLVLVDKNENYLHEVLCELSSGSNTFELFYSLSNITNKSKQQRIFTKYQPEIIFHAAAQKHVPLSEDNPDEAIWNNVIGTKIISDLADKFGVKHFLMVSTDKAVNPTSIMGVTKRIAELYIQSLSEESRTKFVTVRFGNVLNSNGSVVPIFMKQIENGGPVTVTHPSIERYFMSISEAVQLILQAVTMGHSREIFILDMGKSIRIVDLAIELIKQAGLKPFEDIPIKISGLRPGEKLFEELIGRNEQLIPTSHDSIQTLKTNHNKTLTQIAKQLEDLTKFGYQVQREELIRKLQEIVPEYRPSTISEASLTRKAVTGSETEITPFDYNQNLFFTG